MKNTVLVVDDMKLNIDMLTNILKDDYIIMAAVSGENAIKLLERKCPDIVLLDVSMPGIDGFGVLEYMNSNSSLSGVPVIFVSGEHDANMEEKGLLMGAVDYVKKPFNANIVKIKVRNHLELKNYRDNLEQIVEERTMQLAASREAIIMGMSLMSETHDRVTGAHIERIKRTTGVIATRLMEAHPGLVTKEWVEKVTLFSPLHDLGKIGISDGILKKTGILTPEEYSIMKMHTLDGAELLRKTKGYLVDETEVDDLTIAVEIAECHHEKYDGSGYPQGIKGEEIPLSARVVQVADVYDALRSPRSYKRAFSHEEAVDIILNGDKITNPRQFDPMVLMIFNNIKDELRDLYDNELQVS